MSAPVVERDPQRVLDAELAQLLGWRWVRPSRATAEKLWGEYDPSARAHLVPPEERGSFWEDATDAHDGDATLCPRYHSDGNDMLALIEAMRERGWWRQVNTHLTGKPMVVAYFYGGEGRMATGFGDTEPQAVALAAKAALEREALWPTA